MVTQTKNTPGAFQALTGVLTLLALTYNVANAQNIMLDGTVTGAPFGNHPPTAVTAELKQTGDPLGSTETEENGYYNLLLVGTPEQETLENKVYPNPFQRETRIIHNTFKASNYELRISDISGKQIFAKSIYLDAGKNTIDIAGLGGAGVKIIQLSNGEEKQVYKTIQTEPGVTAPRIRTTNAPLEKILKNTRAETDSILMLYTSNGYYPFDTTVAWGNHTINPTLQKIPVIHNFLVKPYTINEEDINQLTLDFVWGNGDVTQHSVESDGYIHVYREELENPTSIALVTHNSDTATYSLWQYFRTKNHNLADTNYAQSLSEYTELGVYTPPEPTPLRLEGIPDTLLLYMPHTKVPHPQIPGDSIRMDDPLVMAMMGGRAPVNKTTKFIPIPQIYSGNYEVIHFQMGYNMANGNPIPEDWLQIAREQRDIIRSAFTLNQGTRIFPKDTAIVIYSTSDPMFLMMQQNNNFDQTAATWFETGIPYPYNGLEHTTLYSPNGEIRMRHTVSAYYNTNVNDIKVEVYQQYTNTADPYTGGGIASWVLDLETGGLSKLGLEMLRMIYFSNLGTHLL